MWLNRCDREACVGHLVGGWSVETVEVDVSRDFPGRPGILMRRGAVLPHGLCFVESLGLLNGLLELMILLFPLILRADLLRGCRNTASAAEAAVPCSFVY